MSKYLQALKNDYFAIPEPVRHALTYAAIMWLQHSAVWPYVKAVLQALLVTGGTN